MPKIHPTFMYGPEGAAKIFHDSDDFPEGWTDSPRDHDGSREPAQEVDPDLNADGLRTDGPTLAEYVDAGYDPANYPPKGYASKEPAAGMVETIVEGKLDGQTREQLMEALEKRGVTFKKNAFTKVLAKLLADFDQAELDAAKA